MRRFLPGLGLVLLAASSLDPASAQVQTIVSPAGYATVEGGGSSALPWLASPFFQPSRWLAIHDDLGGTQRAFTAISFRRDGAAATQPGTRTVDVEIAMGSSRPYDRPSWVFANNWLGTPTTVLPRQLVNLGPYVGTGSPAPFELRFLFANPFQYSGQGAVAFEARIFGNTAAGLTNSMDAVAASGLGGFPGLPRGQGCTATGQSSPMTLSISHGCIGSTYTFGAVVNYAPANAPTILAFGSTNPDLPLPGLCNRLMTDLVATLDLGLADANGLLAETLTAGSTTFYLPSGPSCLAIPNTFAGATYYLQAHSLDTASTWPIRVASSNGLLVYAPPVSNVPTSKVTTLFTVEPSPTHAAALFMANNIGFGLVTEFRW